MKVITAAGDSRVTSGMLQVFEHMSAGQEAITQCAQQKCQPTTLFTL
jgi:hypothetical protein